MRLSLIAVDLILGILAIQCLTTESLFGKKQVEHESDEDLAARKSVNAGLEALKLAMKDPTALQDFISDLKDPAVMMEVKKMMKDPAFVKQFESIKDNSNYQNILKLSNQKYNEDKISEVYSQVAAKAALANAEKEKIEREVKSRGGAYNAQLGLHGLSQAASDPDSLLETMEMLKDPEVQKEVQEMMKDPAFIAEMKKYTDDPLFKKAMEKAKGVAEDPEKMRDFQNKLSKVFKNDL